MRNAPVKVNGRCCNGRTHRMSRAYLCLLEEVVIPEFLTINLGSLWLRRHRTKKGNRNRQYT